MRVCVLGAGSWGTALAQHLARGGHTVTMWAFEAEEAETINNTHRNRYYLTDTELVSGIRATTSFAEALAGAEAAVMVSPSAFVRSVAHNAAPYVPIDLPVILCSKGIEDATGDLLSEVLEQEWGNPDRIAVLSGPNHAEEVIKAIPAATVIASNNDATAVLFQHLLASDTFRTYVSDDPKGVQLCGAFKNVIAIAVGISYGLGYGDNTAAMLITRGLAEMSRMVVACGGQALTCLGLAGTGDMVATCMSQHSRNRRFGEALTKGVTLDEFHQQTQMVVEGALACKTLRVLEDRFPVELPLTDMVHAVVWEGLDLNCADDLLRERPLTTEFHDLGTE